MEELVEFLRLSEYKVGKREIANAFNIKGDDRIALKQMLKKLDDEGIIERSGRRDISVRNELKSPASLIITGTNHDGELVARPETFPSNEKMPTIIITDDGNVIPKVGVNDMVLAKLIYQEKNLYYAKVLKRLSSSSGKVVGIYETNGKEGHLLMVDSKIKTRFIVNQRNSLNAKHKDIVVAEIFGNIKDRVRPAKIVKIIGKYEDAKASTLVSIAKYDLPVQFRDKTYQEIEKFKEKSFEGYEDLTRLNFVTVDGEDAKDFDDAVLVEFNENGSFKAYVAIADVARYVKYGSSIDLDARDRGNSTYFPDKALHMLPDELASNLCSLKEGVVRPVLVCEIDVDAQGNKINHKFYRATIKSKARLTYNNVLNAFKGDFNDKTSKLKDEIAGLFKAYQILKANSTKRGALIIDSPENKLRLDEKGNVLEILKRVKDESTEMIEELMVLANVCAAETLMEHEIPAVYRVHEPPTTEKLNDLYDFLSQFNVEINYKKDLEPSDFNKIIEYSKNTEFYEIINDMVLRSQSKAYYSKNNIGHFGLSLDNYTHFTSPIRRYSDLITHRALIKALDLGKGGITVGEIERMEDIACHISATERQSEQAERDATSRYIAHFMENKINQNFKGFVAGVTKFGLFIRLDGYFVDGFVPMSKIKNGFFSYDSLLSISILV